MPDPTNGFISTIWGPTFWFTLHCISLNFPLNPSTEDRKHYRMFFESLQHVLPCGICRDNFKQNLEEIGYDPRIHFQSRAIFSYLVYKLHRQVRRNQNKPTDMTYIDCCTFYEQFRASSCLANTHDTEGGCTTKQKLQCTIHIDPDVNDNHDDNNNNNNNGRYLINPSCGIINNK